MVPGKLLLLLAVDQLRIMSGPHPSHRVPALIGAKILCMACHFAVVAVVRVNIALPDYGLTLSSAKGQ